MNNLLQCLFRISCSCRDRGLPCHFAFARRLVGHSDATRPRVAQAAGVFLRLRRDHCRAADRRSLARRVCSRARRSEPTETDRSDYATCQVRHQAGCSRSRGTLYSDRTPTPSLITNAKLGLDSILSDAVEAKISFNAAGESALAARFANAQAAATALNRYGSFFQFAQVTGSDAGGWTARRFNGRVNGIMS